MQNKSISGQYDVSWRTEQYVENIFARNFYSLHTNVEKDVQLNLQQFPDEFENVYPAKMLEKIEGKYCKNACKRNSAKT